MLSIRFSILILIFVISNVLSKNIDIDQKWMKFKIDFVKNYNSTDEEQTRKSIWLKNVLYVENFSHKNLNFQVEINELSDKRIDVG
jgi:hypothetical protein